MIYGSVCSGIEAATVAWHPLGWRPAFFAEIDKFPSAVLGHHYPDVPNLGDFTKVSQHEPIDLLVGGTPCQSFSVAGLRGGLADDRGNLALEFLRLAQRARPRWLVWENVPGVLSSNDGRDFGAILGGMVELGYGFAYRVLDAQHFGVPQRRRRVFVVGYLGDWRPAAAVLFERHSLSWHPPPSREAGKDVALPIGTRVDRGSSHREAEGNNLIAPTTPARHSAGGGLGTDFDRDGGLITAPPLLAKGQISADAEKDFYVAQSLNAKGGIGRIDAESETFVCDTLTVGANQTSGFIGEAVTHSLRADGFDASEDGTGRGTPMVFDWQSGGDSRGLEPQERPQLQRCQVPAVAFAIGSHAGAADGDQTNRSHAKGGPVGSNISDGTAYSLRSDRTQSVASAMSVRRLTPRECERLQGFPDDYTLIPYRGKQAADGPRYKALGNSMAVPVMRWIGERIAMTEIVRAKAA